MRKRSIIGTRYFVDTYVRLDVAARDRVAEVWDYVRTYVPDVDEWIADVSEQIRDRGADSKPFRREARLAARMGEHADRRSHPYAFTPQMASALGKVAEAAECDEDEAWDLICDTFPSKGGDYIIANLPEVAKAPKPDPIEQAIALLSANIGDERVIAFIKGIG